MWRGCELLVRVVGRCAGGVRLDDGCRECHWDNRVEQQ